MGKRVIRRPEVIEGLREGQALAATLGGTVRFGRTARRYTLNVLSEKVGLSRARLSQIERGAGMGTPLGTWVALGIALQQPLAVSFTRPLDEPRTPADAGHLQIQEYLLKLARATGRPGTFELPTRPTDPLRSTDVGIRDPGRRVRILAECWNTFGDIGAATRATHRKHAEAAATWPDDRIATVWVVRTSAANRSLIARYPHIIDASFSGSSRRWIRAFVDGDEPPMEPGLVWFDPATDRLTEWRRATMLP